MKETIAGIIFDLGGVVLESFEFGFYKDIKKRFGVPIEKLEKVCAAHWSRLEMGKETNLAYWQTVAEELSLQDSSGAVMADLWLKHFQHGAKIKKGTLVLAKKLAENFKLGVISNTQKEHSIFNRKRGLFDNFDAVILSNEVGLRKPQKAIFSLAAKKMQLPFKSLLFIDNDIRWVKVARKYGLHAILFTTVVQLKNDLKNIIATSRLIHRIK